MPVSRCGNCHQCQAETKTEKLPMGWKRHPQTNEPVCKNCWRKEYVLRAIEIPVAGPVDNTWDEFRPALKEAWQRATRLANWGVQQLMMNDVIRTAEMEKLPKMPKIYLYGLANEQNLIAGWSSSACSVLQAVEKRYRATRYERIWLGKTRLPDTRYPLPYPVHNNTWTAKFVDECPVVSFRLPAARFSLRLRGGKEFRRQLASFKQIVSGEAIKGELVIYQKGANGADHRNGMNGNGKPARVIVKMVAWLPRKEWTAAEGTMLVGTSADAMLVAWNQKEKKLWSINGDHIQRWTITHQVQLKRWSEDSKMELRRRRRLPFAERRKAACQKFNNRMNTAADQMAAQAVNYAKRRKFATIRWYPDGEKFVESFRWYRLAERLRTKCNEYGIEFELGKQEELTQC